ncbi:MAG TPA: carboxypeptidase regulatory-like domain-containing protein [Candidatus Sulfotelmatobacter sp.]
MGTVQDRSGALVPGATVTAVRVDTGIFRQTTSNSHGDFSFNNMEPGDYSLTFTASGFQTKKLDHLILTTGEILPISDLKLEVGSLAQTTTVFSEGGQVMTESSERSDLISSTQIDNLVVRGRNFTDLTTLLPGVIDTVKSTDISTSPAIYVNGNRDTSNAIYIDGIPADDMSSTQMKDMISQDAVNEVKVETSNYEAEYGRQAGSNIIAVTKSGTQDFHGLVSYFNRNEAYNANNYFNNLNGIARPIYRYNTITYNIGGPVIIPHLFDANRNKLFFFWNQELWPTKITETGAVTVPNALERLGNFSQSYQPSGSLYAVTNPFNNNAAFPQNTIPEKLLNANGLALLNLFPSPNFTNTAISKGNYNYVFSVPVATPLSTETLRIDYHPTQNDTVSGSFNAYSDTNTGSVGATANTFNWPEAIDTYYTRSKAESLRWMHIFSPVLLNEFHFGYLYQPAAQTITNDQLQKLSRSAAGLNLGQLFPAANPLNLLPNASFGGVPNAATINIDSRFPLTNQYHLYNWSDDVSYTHGTHNFRAGIYAEYYTRHQKTQATDYFNGSFDFENNKSNPLNAGYAYANVALGVFNTYNETSTAGLFTLADYDFEGYIQDNWRVTRKLTIDYGLRLYDVTPFTEVNNQVSGFVASQYNQGQAVKLIAPEISGGTRVGIDQLAGTTYAAADIGAIAPSAGNPSDGMVAAYDRGSLPRGLTPGTGIQLGPRAGFAYDVHGNGKLAVRGGFGIFRNRFSENYFDDFVAQAPIAQTPQIYYGQLSNFLSSSGLLFPSNVYGPDTTAHLPLVMNYSLAVQQQVGFDTILDIAYAGSEGRHLPWFVDQNSIPLGADFLAANQNPTKPGSPLPSSFFRPIVGYGSIYQLSNGTTSSYNSLQASLQRRFTRTVTFGVAYTWSKTMDFADTDTATMTPVVPTRAYYHSLAAFDVPQILAINYLYDLPKSPWRNFVANGVLSNWQFSGIGSFQSGVPNGITIATTTGEDITGTTSVSPRASVTGDPNLQRGSRTFAHYFNTSAITLPSVGTYGNAPRLFVRGPGINNWDLALVKNIVLPHEARLVLRGEAYNAFNHTQFSTINTTPDFNPATGAQTNAQFGQVTAARDPRQLQLAARITF